MDLQSMESSDIEVVESIENIKTFIDDKINERILVGSEVPFYVANLDYIAEKHLEWQALLPRVMPFYAVKCNSTPAVLRTLSALGTGFDCASKREIEMVMSFGVTPDRIIYAHTTKPQSHIRYACAHGVEMMTFDCEEELLKISTCHPNAKLVLRIAADNSKSLVQLSTKFGAKLHTVGKLLELAQQLDLNVIGVSFHVGTVCTDSVVYLKAIADARQVFDEAISLGFNMSLLDIGGGFIDNKGFQKTAETISEALDEFFPADSGVRIISEPGQYFVRKAFTLAMNVITKKHVLSDSMNSQDEEKVMMYYMSDGIYGSFNVFMLYPELKENISLDLHRPVESSEPKYQSIIWGPTCHCLDKITNTVWMPELHVGDWLLYRGFGAYSLSMSSDFNGFEKALIYPVVTAETWNMLFM